MSKLSEKISEIVVGSLGIAGIAFLFHRVGLFGLDTVTVYDDDRKIGIFNRFLYHEARFEKAGTNEVVRVWSFCPLYFSTKSSITRSKE